MTIFIDENIPLLAEAIEQSASSQQITLAVRRFNGRTVCATDLQDCSALIVRSTTRVNAALLQGTPVQFVATATSGSEHVDTAYLLNHGIQCCDARGCNANSVAEYVLFALLLWEERTSESVSGKTLGLVGYGHIGQRVAELAHRLGMHIVVSDLPFLVRGGGFAEYCEAVPFAELIAVADVVTNHVPLVVRDEYATKWLFNQTVLEKLRLNALFIHASRGKIVEEAALLRAIEERGITACVDVWEDEPRVNAAMARQCLLATPHIAGYSYEGKINSSVIVARHLEHFLRAKYDATFRIHQEVFSEALRFNNPPLPDWENHATLLAQLRHSRKLEADTLELLASLEAHDQEARFDALRKTYPVRREILRDSMNIIQQMILKKAQRRIV
jgi:erythronate-4-phosphate dehydrogenase